MGLFNSFSNSGIRLLSIFYFFVEWFWSCIEFVSLQLIGLSTSKLPF